MADPGTSRLILASGSASRQQMLRAAGVAFDVVASTVDEAAIKRDLDSGIGAAGMSIAHGRAVARELARAKALEVSGRERGATVIGADQTLTLLAASGLNRAARAFDKPAGLAHARDQLRQLRGRMHVLCAAVAVVCDGTVVWETDDVAHLTMRTFSDAFLDDYLARAGERVCSSVGAYQLEGLGLQLFETIDGDYFTILGLPLLPLLDQLRQRFFLAS